VKEYSLKPGDTVDQWTIDRHVANGCIYAVTKEDDPREYAFKLREPCLAQYFWDEIKLLKNINPSGERAQFQKLVEYSGDELYMILHPLMDPSRQFRKQPTEIIAALNVERFVTDFFNAIQHAATHGRALASDCHFFLTDDGLPFFLGLIDEPAWEGPQSLNIRFIESVMMRLINETGYLSREKMLDPVFNPRMLLAPGSPTRQAPQRI